MMAHRSNGFFVFILLAIDFAQPFDLQFAPSDLMEQVPTASFSEGR